jgi:hypothetical protein
MLSRSVIACALVSSGTSWGCSDITLPQRTAWEGELQSLPPAQVGGSVAVLSQSGRSETSILITGAQREATYAWRIRTGSCEAGGDVVGGVAIYPTLSPDASGQAEGETILSRQLDRDGTYATWVFQVLEDAEEPAACGSLARLSGIS